MIGKEISGFKIVEKIGEGGMGKVYKAIQPSLNRCVAIKAIPPYLARQKAMLEKFYLEARSLAKLNHPNIVVIHDVFEFEGVHYIAMEYIDGQSLREILNTRASVGYDMSVYILSALSDVCLKAHACNIVHRDIKPENIMITEDGRVKMMDFGLAKSLVSSGKEVDGSTLGTPDYMSPEQCRGEMVDDRSDLYSLGIVVYESIIGQTPFHGMTIEELFSNKLTAPSPRLEDVRLGLSDGFVYIVNKLIEHDKLLRYQNAHELVGDLEKNKLYLTSLPEKITLIKKPSQVSYSATTAVFTSTTGGVSENRSSRSSGDRDKHVVHRAHVSDEKEHLAGPVSFRGLNVKRFLRVTVGILLAVIACLGVFIVYKKTPWRDMLKNITSHKAAPESLASKKVYMKNGRVLEGKIISRDNDIVIIDIGAAKITLKQEDIEKIE